MSRRLLPGALVLTLAACGGSSASAPLGEADCTAPEPARLPDVLLVTFDTLRADHCSSYGYARPTTPTLDRVGAAGVLFETAYAVTPTTGPSHATLFTSLYPDEHGVLSNRWELQGEVVTLAEMLRSVGYRTGGFASSGMVSAEVGMAQGFDAFDDEFVPEQASSTRREFVQDEPVHGDFDRRAEYTAERALEWLGAQPADEPVFLWLHSYQPHNPYKPSKEALQAVLGDEFDGLFGPGRPAEPAEDDQRSRKIARYDAETYYADQQVARVLAALEARAREPGLLSIVTSDHGEGLDDHDWGGHGIYLFEEAVHVPLVLAWPGRIPAGRRVDAAVGLIDVLPTMLGLLEVDCEGADLRGADLAPAWTGVRFEGTGPIFLQRRFYSHREDKFNGKAVTVKGSKHAVRAGGWKLVVQPEEGPPQLFDLDADPAELQDVAERHPEVVEELEALLEEWKAGQWLRVPELPSDLDEEDLEALNGLGYVY